MAANVSSRKRLRGESGKEKIANLWKDAVIRLFVSKQHLPVYLLNNTDVEFSRRVAAAHVKGVNPLFDHVDWTILFCWDQLYSIFARPFVGYAYVEKKFQGFKTWRDAAAALFIAFVANDETFYSQAARPSKEHPNRRPYHRYKGRRKELGLHPHKRAVITGAPWDRIRDILHVASKADGWGWEIHRFNPHAPQIN